MNPIDYECSYFDVPTNFACKALPGELCKRPDGEGGRWASRRFHPERIEAAAAMNAGPGEVPTVAEFDRAAEAALEDLA